MKGYISQYNPPHSVHHFDNDVTTPLYQSILDECFALMEGGYNSYLLDSDKKFSADETLITAGICGHIENIIEVNGLPFDIVPEYFVYDEKIKKGEVAPRKAKRFDLRIIRWNEKNLKLKFGVEAKLLAETNYKNKNASNLIKEYVEDKGMGKFINKIYDQNAYHDGFMLAHILNGKIENIKDMVNQNITATYSVNEHLRNYKKHYVSTYSDNGKRKNLYHIFLDFSELVILD